MKAEKNEVNGAELVAQWRAAFDRSFAEPAQARSEELQDFLGIRVAGQPYALQLGELAGLQAWHEPTPYPVPSAALLGLIAHQGRALPLFDLQTLLGQGLAAAPAWIVVLKGAALALAFEGFEGQWRLAPQDRVLRSEAGGGGLLGDAVRCGGALRPVIDLAAVAAQRGRAHF